MHIILTPHEYYMVLLALAINGLKSRLPHQLCTLHLLSNSIVYSLLLQCDIMTVLSLRKIPFYILGLYHAEYADTAVCTPDFAVLPSALSGSPH